MQKALEGKSMRDLAPEERAKVMQRSSEGCSCRSEADAGCRRRRAAVAPGGMGGGMMGGGVAAILAKATSRTRKLPAAWKPNLNSTCCFGPGLLADVEIILEKIPNAINIPNQAVFEKDGKQIVYVAGSKGWEERVIKPMKRSESMMVIASGVKPGDVDRDERSVRQAGRQEEERQAGDRQARHAGMPGGGRS